MLTGFNTDITHLGTVFHIQTEDGGESNPTVVTLVYQGGRILTSKKTSYAKILGTEDLLRMVRQLMKNQHYDMVRAVHSGSLSADRVVPSSPEPHQVVHGPNLPPDDREDTHEEKNLDQIILEYLASEIEKE